MRLTENISARTAAPHLSPTVQRGVVRDGELSLRFRSAPGKAGPWFSGRFLFSTDTVTLKGIGPTPADRNSHRCLLFTSTKVLAHWGQIANTLDSILFGFMFVSEQNSIFFDLYLSPVSSSKDNTAHPSTGDDEASTPMPLNSSYSIFNVPSIYSLALSIIIG